MQRFIKEFRRIKIGSRRGFNTRDQKEMGRFLDTAIEDEDGLQLDKYIHIAKLKIIYSGAWYSYFSMFL